MADAKVVIASPEFQAASMEQKRKMLAGASPSFASQDEAWQRRYLSSRFQRPDASPPRAEAMKAANVQTRNLLVSSALGAGLPIAGAVAGGVGAARAGLGPLASAALRTTGAAAGGGLSGALTGHPAMMSVTGNPALDQALMASVFQGAPELLSGAGIGAVKGARAVQSAKALSAFEDQAAGKFASVQDAIPWWKNQFSRDHKGLVDMVYGRGQELLSQGYGKTVESIGPHVKDAQMLLPIPAARRLGLETKGLAREPAPALGMPDEVMVNMKEVVDRLPRIRERDPGAYSDIVRHVDRHLGEVTGLPSQFQAARKAYAEGQGFMDSMREGGAVSPVTKRFDLEKFSQNMIKKDVLNANAARTRAPATRETIQEVSPLARPTPERMEHSIRMPFFTGGPVGGHIRAYEHVSPLTWETVKNVPGGPAEISPVISRGLPQALGGASQLAREAIESRREP